MIATTAYAMQEGELGSTAISMPGLVGCYFGLRVCLTFLFFQSEPQLGAAVGFAVNLLLLIPVAVYASGRGAFTFKQALGIGPFRLVLAFLGLALGSLLWSETSSVAVAFGYWMALAGDVLLVYSLLRAEAAGSAAESLLKGFICGVLLLSLIAWSAPAMQDLRLGDNEFLTPNAIGFECALGALLCQYFAPQGARWKWLGAALAITLLRSLSKTSIAAFLVVEVFYLLRARTMSRAAKIGLAVGALVVAAAFSGLIVSYYAVYINAGNQAETLTGRTAIWLVTLSFAVEKPWLGHGFHSYRSVIPAFGDFQPWHAHNELLQQFFAYGVVGVALVVALYVSLFRQIRRSSQQPIAFVAGALLLLVVIRGVADTERFDLSFPLWAITAITLTLAQDRRLDA